MSDVIRNCGRFAVFCSVIGPENSHNSTLTPITNWLAAFSRALVPAFSRALVPAFSRALVHAFSRALVPAFLL